MKNTLIHRAWQAIILSGVMILMAACTTAPTAVVFPTTTLKPTAATSEAATPSPSLPAKTQVACTETEGRLVNASLPAKMLKYPLAVKVYLPPCYTSNHAGGYPVLYMLHGMTDTNEQWVTLGLTVAADRLITSKTIQPVIIVMPYEVNWQLSPEQSGYSDAIINVLIPWVESSYNACTTRDCRAIGGLSRGGNWAVWIGFNHWKLFNAIGAHSTPLFIGGQANLRSAIRGLPTLADAPAVYVDVGDKDENLEQVREFEQILTEMHIPHEYHLNTGIHDYAYWSSHVEEYLLWYAEQLKK